jgi:hypothetical protein
VRRIPALSLRVAQRCLPARGWKAPGYGALQTLRAVRLRLCRAASIAPLRCSWPWVLVAAPSPCAFASWRLCVKCRFDVRIPSFGMIYAYPPPHKH